MQEEGSRVRSWEGRRRVSRFVAVLRALLLISHPRKPRGISSGLFTLAGFDFGRDVFFCPVLTNCPRVSEDDSSL